MDPRLRDDVARGRSHGPGPARARESLVLSLGDAATPDGRLVGGKARALGELIGAGARVPPGFVVTDAALTWFLEERRLTAPGPAADTEELQRFRDRLRGLEFPRELEDILTSTHEEAFEPGTAVAVRSSAAREDLAGASFAGQYETVLNVRDGTALLDAIKRCWASLWSSRVRAYEGTGATAGPMAVIVQEMVDAEASGVCFTVNPLSGREEEMLVEAAFGLGEGVVSGRVHADRYVVGATTGEVLERTIQRKRAKIVSGPEGTVEVPVDPEEAEASSLSGDRLAELIEACRAIQLHFGRPMDVEWAFAGGELFILQARPITSIAFTPELGEWTTADFRDGGVASDVCTPFMWSLYDDALSRSMPSYFKRLRLVPPDHEAEWGRMFFGRPYWNLGEVKRALERVPGYDEAAFHADLGVRVDADFEPRTTPISLRGVVAALPTLLALKRLYREGLAANRAFVAGAEDRRRPFDLAPDQLPALSGDVFRERYHTLISELYLETETTYFTTIYNTANAKRDLDESLGRVERALGRKVDGSALLAGLRDLSHLRAMKDLRKVVRELRATGAELDEPTVRAFAWRWRHRGRRELDIQEPRWAEDLEHVRALMERALEEDDSAHDSEHQEEALHRRYRETLEGILADLRWRPFLRFDLRRKLERMRRYAWWREEMRDHSSFAYYLVRLWTLEAGRRLVEAGALERTEDVWCLPWRTVADLLEGRLQPSRARVEVARGREAYRSFRNFDNPGEIGVHFRQTDPNGGSDRGQGSLLQGTACSSGEVSGRARVLSSLGEASRISKGDILVTSFTDPGWTPLFSRIAGVVTETGGVLSHAAVISREYGVPAVLGVRGATEAIGDGDHIRVDGGRGVVEIEVPGGSGV